MISTNRNILLIDNKDSFTYNLVQAFEELNCVVTVSEGLEQSIRLMDEFDKIVFSPGPGLPNEFPVMFEVLRLCNIRTKILGICLGHQAIAQFFGATLFKQDQVQHGQRKRIINICKIPKSALFNMPTQFESGLYHSWAVDLKSLPEVLTVTCMSEDGVIMGICHNELSIEGFQFHPESFLTTKGSALLNNWLNL